MEDYKEQIKDLYLEGKTCKQIGDLLNKSEKTTSYHLKNMGVTMRTNKKIDDSIFEELFNDNYSDEELANYFKVSLRTIKSHRQNKKDKYKRVKFSENDDLLNELQEQMILGSVLGDLNIRIPKNCANGNARLSIVQSEQQEELFMEKVKILDTFMASYKLTVPKPDPRTGKVYKSWRGSSRAHKEFTKIYNLLYINDIKTITIEFLNKIYHPIALAYWFMDDGTERGTLSTHCFKPEEITLLIDWMYSKFNIECTRQKNSEHETIYVKESSRRLFESLIEKYVVPSMRYKLKYFAQSV